MICQLQMMVAYASLFSSLVIERIGQRIGLCCLFSLLLVAFLCVVYERLVIYLCIYYATSLFIIFLKDGETVIKHCSEFCLLVGCRIYNDIRFSVIFQLILPLGIPGVAYMYRSKYTHSTYWFWSMGKTCSFVIMFSYIIYWAR